MDEFEVHRSHLRAVAYRLLGSPSDADNAVQEAWVRLARTDTNSIHNSRAWLTTAVARVCLDMLRSHRARRELFLDAALPAAGPCGEAVAVPAPVRSCRKATTRSGLATLPSASTADSPPTGCITIAAPCRLAKALQGAARRAEQPTT